jgi:hypothetical protein
MLNLILGSQRFTAAIADRFSNAASVAEITLSTSGIGISAAPELFPA